MSKKQKKDKAARSTRQLMGIEEIKDYCIATRMGNLVFFIIKPTNISVLPDSSISARIYALLNVVKDRRKSRCWRSIPKNPSSAIRTFTGSG